MKTGEGHFNGLLVESTAVAQNPLGSSNFQGQITMDQEESYRAPGNYMKFALQRLLGGVVWIPRAGPLEGRQGYTGLILRTTPITFSSFVLRYVVEIWNNEVT